MAQPFGEDHANQNLAYELELAEQVTEPVDRQLQQFAQQAAAAYITIAGSQGQPLNVEQSSLLRRLLLWLLDKLRIDVADRLRRRLQRGAELGYNQATELARQAGLTLPPQPLHDQLAQELLQSINQLDERANGHIRNTAEQLTRAPLDNWDDLVQVIAKTRRARNTVDQTTRWAANRAISGAVRDVAAGLQARVVWVAERDACLHCLAYAGEVAGPDDWFPGGLTFYRDPEGNPKPVGTYPVWAPPLHPNCRCSLEVWAGYDTEKWGPDAASLVGVPQVLKREAQRSVLRGFSGFASEPARLRAADALLDRAGQLLGPSVRRRARQDVEAGRFMSAERVLGGR